MIYTYDPKKITVTVASLGLLPVPIRYTIEGFAPGTFVTVNQDRDVFEKVECCDGITTRVKRLGTSGTASITLLQSSPSNDDLNVLLDNDEENNSTMILNVFDVWGSLSPTLCFSSIAWIRKKPRVEFGNSTGTREWVFDCDNMEMRIGGSSPAG